MTNEDIKKALATCAGDSCDNCRYYEFHNCYDKLKLDARDRIIRQDEEIKRLREKLTKVLLAVDTVKVVTSSVETYVKWRLDVFANTLKKHARSFLMRDTSDGQYRDEQYVPVVTIDHILMLLTDGNDGEEVPYDYRLDT